MDNIKLKIKEYKSLNKLKELIKDNNITLVLFGEYHGFSIQISILKEIIKITKPDFFLYEMLEEKKILNNKDAKHFLNKLDNKDFSFISTYGQLKPIIRLARNFNLQIIGCDIKNMGCKNKDWRKNKISREDGEELTKRRELQQTKVINQYTLKGVVFALVGDHHLRRGSLVLSKLNNERVVIIRPSFKWSEKFNHPNKFSNSEISYIARLQARKI